MPAEIALIIPTYNEARELPDLLEHLLHWKKQGIDIIIVDGGSQDNSVEIIKAIGFNVIETNKGRAKQMNVGAWSTEAKLLVFLHADTRLPDNVKSLLEKEIHNPESRWGRFDLKIVGRSLGLPIVSFFVNLRSRLTSIATGDQAIFVKRNVFESVGGFKDQPLMEDIELSKSLKGISRPKCLTAKVTTSGRRWDKYGLLKTIWLMWSLRWDYWKGVSPEQLAKRYS